MARRKPLADQASFYFGKPLQSAEPNGKPVGDKTGKTSGKTTSKAAGKTEPSKGPRIVKGPMPKVAGTAEPAEPETAKREPKSVESNPAEAKPAVSRIALPEPVDYGRPTFDLCRRGQQLLFIVEHFAGTDVLFYRPVAIDSPESSILATLPPGTVCWRREFEDWHDMTGVRWCPKILGWVRSAVDRKSDVDSLAVLV